MKKELIRIYDKLENVKLYQFIYELGNRMSEHKLFILAGGIAFNILLYIIPLVLILVLFVNIFVEPDVLITAIDDGINRYLPGIENYKEIITSVVAEVNNVASSSKIFGIVGIVILLWLSSTVISTLNSCITHIFGIAQPHYFKTKLKDIATTILLNILILLYGVLLPTFSFTTSFINSITHDAEISIWLSKTIVVITNIIVSGLFFYFIYWIIPSSKTKKIHRISLNATLIAVFATEIARYLFTLYISSISNYSKFYGTYAVMVTMAVWLFYSCFIILFSAELSKYLYDIKEKREMQLIDSRSIIEKYRYKQKLKKAKIKKNKK